MYQKDHTDYVYARFRRLLPRSRDPVLVVLKAHLLAEERLDWILNQFVRSSAPLKNARLTFYQKLKLAHAFLGDGFDREVKFLENLNSVRNVLSHNAEVIDINERIDKVIQTFDPEEQFQFETQAQRLTTLKNTVMFACAFLEGATMTRIELAGKNVRFHHSLTE